MSTRTDKVIDWLCEPRLPHHAPIWLWRRFKYPRADAPVIVNEPVPVALTFDVEQDLGSRGSAGRWDACPPFLDWLTQTSRTQGWQTTVFVQGSIVEPLAGLLRGLAGSHELGLHGYYHEIWGRSPWFLRQVAPPAEERRGLLAKGIQAFADAGLPRPRSFRAPYLICDDTTLRLLEEEGFELDSSAPAYRGCEPVISRHGRLVRIPISGTPRPRIHRRWRIPTWAPYDHLDLRTFLYSSPDELRQLVSDILTLQDAQGSPRQLVVLAHSWDFIEVPGLACTPDNYQHLVERARLLASFFPVRFETISQTACPGVLAHQ